MLLRSTCLRWESERLSRTPRLLLLTPRLRGLIESGRARRARRSITDLPAPDEGPDLTAELAAMRDAERF